MNDKCNLLHRWFNSNKRFKFPFSQDLDFIPKNGIYIIFENGEKCNDLDRIVRIGTHTGINQLRSRLNQHFVNENKDRSIFRKNIGRCLLNIENSPYSKIWEIDFTTRKNKDEYGNLVDEIFQKQLETRITEYIQDSLSFTVIEVDNKAERMNLESKIISTISLCKNCKPSSNWLGLYSTKPKIRESGLWQVNELYKEPLNQSDMEKLELLVMNMR